MLEGDYLNMRKGLAWVGALMTAFMLPCSAASYENYIYTYDGVAVREPQAYLPGRIVDGEEIGVGQLREPQDLFVAENGDVAVADTGNNRVLLLDGNFRLKEELADLGNGITLSGPRGVYIRDDYLYIADSGNRRLVCVSLVDLSVVVYDKPTIPIQEDLEFIPVKVAVDSAGRIFVVCEGVNQGMLELDAQGEFVSFYGAIKVSPTPMQIFWRRFMTEEQLNALESIIPTEYSNLDVDEEDFVYGTISALDPQQLYNNVLSQNNSSSQMPIRKLNPVGRDILRKNAFYPPVGLLDPVFEDGVPAMSRFTDVCVGHNGLYAVLDAAGGKVYAYDNDANLLFTFGSIGSTSGSLGQPSALDVLDDGRYLVLDSLYGQFVEYRPTDYARLVLEASEDYFNREYEQAEAKWQEVVQYTANSDLAFVGMGKAQLRLGKYGEAMEYFRLGHDQELYSKAFNEYRNQWVSRHFTAIATALLLLAVLGFAVWLVRHRRRRKA